MENWDIREDVKELQDQSKLQAEFQSSESRFFLGIVNGCKDRINQVLGNHHTNDNPLQYSCLENPMDRGAWQVIVYRVA